jgi:Family of unknown function (DUF6403)
MSWLIWLIAAVVLLASGFVGAFLPWRRAQELRKRSAWSRARAAIDSASVSRDACLVTVPDAERLLARAESIAADRGGAKAAGMVSDCAAHADRLWQEARDE